MQNLRITDKLDSGWLINGYSVEIGWDLFLLEMNTNYQLKRVLESTGDQWASIDFSRKGYVLKNDEVCEFYDKDFNYLKERHKFTQGTYSVHQTHIPFGKNYMLENFGGSINYEDYGQHIRIVDSNLYVKRHLVISPGSGNLQGEISPPYFGGIDFLDESTIWVAGNYNLTSDLDLHTHFSISKIDSNLNLICNQYFGFDEYYRLFGIRALENGGAVVYGSKITPAYDSFILTVGPDCELPTSISEGAEGLLHNVTVWPNPTQNSITFNVNGFDASLMSVEIYEPSGKTLFSQNNLSNEVTVSNLPPGQYFYRILEGKKLLGIGSWVKQ